MLLNAPTTEVDIKDPVGAILHQLNKRVARLHYLLMFIGARDKNSRKLLEEIASCRRNCIEICWDIKENIINKVNKISLLGKSEIYLRALTDCLEMYIKEITILQHIQATVQIGSFITVSSKKASKAKKTAKVATENHNTAKLEDDLSLTILAEEKAEVTDLYQLILNRLAAGDSSATGDEGEGTSNGNKKSSRRRKTDQSLKTSRSSRLLCCTCSNDYV